MLNARHTGRAAAPALIAALLLVAGCGKDHPDLSDADDAVAEEIEDLGGTVVIEDGKVVEVDLSVNENVNDETLATVKKLSGLKKLYLTNLPTITDAGLAHVAEMRDLEVLQLDGTQVTAAGLKHLEGLTKLRMVFLRRTSVRPPDANELKKKIDGLLVTVDAS